MDLVQRLIVEGYDRDAVQTGPLSPLEAAAIEDVVTALLPTVRSQLFVEVSMPSTSDRNEPDSPSSVHTKQSSLDMTLVEDDK